MRINPLAGGVNILGRKIGEVLSSASLASGGVALSAEIDNFIGVQGAYAFRCAGPREVYRQRYLGMRAELYRRHAADPLGGNIINMRVAHLGVSVELPSDYELRSRMIDALELKWDSPEKDNTVVTVGKNDLLDKYLAGSSYTATPYMGLISSTSYSAIAAGDTMSSHAGWLEAGTANNPTYSQSTRVAPSWASASSGSKASNANIVYSMTSTGTSKGGFLTTVSTKDGTTGILFSAGLFTQGDRAVVNGDTINGSYTLGV